MVKGQALARPSERSERFERCQARTPEKLTQLQRWAVTTAARIGHNKAPVALANKRVRIFWAVWCHERRLSGTWQSVKPA